MKDIAEDLGKTEGTIKNWKKNHPILLEYVKTGAFCKKNGITIEMIKSCIELKEMAKGDGE
jgi:predicted transcriptional regulator